MFDLLSRVRATKTLQGTQWAVPLGSEGNVVGIEGQGMVIRVRFDSMSHDILCQRQHLEAVDPQPAQRGLYRKYRVEKTDDSPVDPDAEYFVLRLDTDANARIAAQVYAALIEQTQPLLSEQLKAQVNRLEESHD